MVVSGTKLAEEIGASRSEVWRLIQQLRTLGVEIAGHPATGYQLKSGARSAVARHAGAGSCAGQQSSAQAASHHYFKIGSTNTAAMEAASAGAPEGSVFLAEQQTRRARTWRAFLAFRAIGRDLLLGGAAAGRCRLRKR